MRKGQIKGVRASAERLHHPGWLALLLGLAIFCLLWIVHILLRETMCRMTTIFPTSRAAYFLPLVPAGKTGSLAVTRIFGIFTPTGQARYGIALRLLPDLPFSS